jgi:DNA-binding MarR family transcriptional regulator
MKKEIPQHVQLPNRKDGDQITPKEQLIYIAIKRYMNAKTLEAFPSLALLSKQTGASIPTIRDAIKVLVDLDYISIRKEGRSHIYKFNPYKQFEPFSYDFLDNTNLSFLEKSYLVASQQYMFKNDNEGSISLSTRELSEKINMSVSSISRCNKSLEAKEFLTTIKNISKDPMTGSSTETKIFHLNKFGQAIVALLANHEERITTNEGKIQELEEKLKDQAKTIELLARELTNKNKEESQTFVVE